MAAHRGGDIFDAAVPAAVVEIGRQRRIAVVCELTGRLAIPFVPAGQVVHYHHRGEGPRA